MTELELPVVSADTSLVAALKRMWDSGRSGIVAEVRHDATLFTADELFDELTHCYEQKVPPLGMTLNEVEPHMVRLDLPSAGRVLKFGHRPGNRRSLEATLASVGAHYAILDIEQRIARILPISMAIGEPLLRRVVFCQCRGNPSHLWRPADVTQRRCRIDGEEVDCNQ
jgi:hypothetical protein